MNALSPTPAPDGFPFTIRLAEIADLPAIEWLDTFGTSPHRDISRQVDRYFGSVDPSVHERNLIFLAELLPAIATHLPYPVIGKVELLLAPIALPSDVGYIKRVVVHPAWRKHGVARIVLAHITKAAPELGVRHLDLHVAEDNTPAITLYESLGFAERHRELYLRLTLNPQEAQPVSLPAERTRSRDQSQS